MPKTLFYTQKNPFASDVLHFSFSKGNVELKVRQPISISNELYEALLYENKGFKATVDEPLSSSLILCQRSLQPCRK